MRRRYGKIAGYGAFIPEHIMTNHDMAEQWDTNHDWIVQRSGIHERRFASPEEPTHVMATKAALQALENAGLEPSDLDMIIVGTCLTEYFTPSVACLVQRDIGANGIPAYDISAGCTGFLYALSSAYQFLETGVVDRILVIGAENITRFLETGDRSTAILFGDAAGAVIVEKTDQPCGLHGFMLGADGSGYDAITLNTSSNRGALDEGHKLKFNGKKVFRFASRVLGTACQEALDKAGMTMDDIDWIIPHQANLRIIQSAARDMQVPMDKFVINLDKYGNTSSASVPLALYEGIESGKIKPTDTVLMVAFGAGLTWGAAVIELAPKLEVNLAQEMEMIDAIPAD
ncbi:MAG: beta-ketoacyl-ACP synthase III [Chloroflexota bacterium]